MDRVPYAQRRFVVPKFQAQTEQLREWIEAVLYPISLPQHSFAKMLAEGDTLIKLLNKVTAPHSYIEESSLAHQSHIVKIDAFLKALKQYGVRTLFTPTDLVMNRTKLPNWSRVVYCLLEFATIASFRGFQPKLAQKIDLQILSDSDSMDLYDQFIPELWEAQNRLENINPLAFENYRPPLSRPPENINSRSLQNVNPTRPTVVQQTPPRRSTSPRTSLRTTNNSYKFYVPPESRFTLDDLVFVVFAVALFVAWWYFIYITLDENTKYRIGIRGLSHDTPSPITDDNHDLYQDYL
eukprot:TRINITY_DN2940_c0_g1_i3.p1 TRINITY_DN2940_c0_g1~~TRINITY_DN2940_c0_g1_i3.p1  ORF type:complete len:295 (-),score=29.77 TRINITY_DN2940_c0_g1_i3:34-918(-)